MAAGLLDPLVRSPLYLLVHGERQMKKPHFGKTGRVSPLKGRKEGPRLSAPKKGIASPKGLTGRLKV